LNLKEIIMIDLDELYFSSDRCRDLLDEIGDGIQEEDLKQRAGNSIEACKHGLKVWENLLELMKMLKADSIYELDDKGATIYDLLYWASKFADELEDASRKHKAFKAEKLNFCETYVAMHLNMLDKEVRNLGNVRTALAESYYKMGKAEEADSLFRKWLNAEPDWGWGWIGWSDCYWFREHIGLEKDFDKAEKILKDGLSITNVFDKDYITERLQDLQKEKNKNPTLP
jgi:tetratricopeptide (TPR) repeat protein